MSQFETTPSLSVRRRHYLRQMILDHTPLKASGIPEIFFPPSIKLEDVFIPLELVCERNPMGIDYPLREEEIPVWQRIFTKRKKRLPRELTDRSFPRENVEIAQFWQNLSREYPVAVVQGYPGMGKSTLMKRLTLHMARRCLKIPDPHLPVLSPALVPLLIELKTYANAFKKAQENKEELPLSSYLPQMLQKRAWQGKNPWPFISRSLEFGACLVLFDSLDEAGDAQVREQVAREINAFILEQRNTPPERKTFNRFLITSRIAGYSPEAFPDTLPYRIAELTEGRMHDLLKLWYRAVVQAEPAAQDAEARMQRLHAAIEEHGSIFRLAENPLLLMLMAAMQKYGIYLPRERAELYDTITLTLLKYREKDKDLPPIDEDEAVRRLGPLAYAMQTTEYVADEQMVMDSLRKTIGEERKRSRTTLAQASDPVSEQAEIEKQIHAFLTLIRERSNLFVQRTGEDFSFFHKSFQEYFAARFLLTTIQHKRNVEITHLVELARQIGDTWREPFLFAIGYQSLGRGRDLTVARDLLKELLKVCEKENDPTQHLHDLLLAADAVLEAKAQTFDDAQEKRIAQGLLICYMEAQRQEKFEDCQKIEHTLRLWLQTLTSEGNQPSLLVMLCMILQDGHRRDVQRATLTLLVRILDGEDYPQPIYETLIPVLLGLADLPALDQHYQPILSTGAVDYTVADLALVTLSRMGRHGPAGILLDVVRQHFEREPAQLGLLARYSLESQRLLTPCVIPQTDLLYQRYIKALDRWFTLKKRSEQHLHRTISKDLSECLAIQQELLASAEEVRYPITLHLLAMLKASHTHPDQVWQEIWQAYLLQQISAVPPNPYVYYQGIMLLWESLFPEKQSLKPVVELLSAHYTQGKEPYHRFAQRFLATISRDLSERRDLRDWKDWKDLRVLRCLNEWRYLRYLRYLSDWRYWKDLRFWTHWKDWKDLRYLKYLRYLMDLRDLRHAFLVPMTAQQAIQALPNADETEAIDLCIILLGRILQIEETNESGQTIVEETQRIVETARQMLAETSSTQKELREALLDILRYLPAHSGEEIAFVRQLAENAADQEIQQSLVQALRFARPHKDALPVLQAAASSTNTLVATAAQQALEREQKRQEKPLA
jgi:hypothetical protein